MLEICFDNSVAAPNRTIVLGFADGGVIFPAGVEFDVKTRQLIEEAVDSALNNERFRGRIGEAVDLIVPCASHAGRVVVAGLKGGDRTSELTAQDVGGHVVARLAELGEDDAIYAMARPTSCQLTDRQWLVNLAYGAMLRNYRFLNHRSALRHGEPVLLDRLTIATFGEKVQAEHIKRFQAVASGRTRRSQHSVLMTLQTWGSPGCRMPNQIGCGVMRWVPRLHWPVVRCN